MASRPAAWLCLAAGLAVIAAAGLWGGRGGGLEDSSAAPRAAREPAAGEPEPEAAGGRGPVILVVVDALRADRLGAWGRTDSLTPHLDALGARGRVFLEVQSTAPWTLPAVASLFTGVLPARHGAGLDVTLEDGGIPVTSTGEDRLRPLEEAGLKEPLPTLALRLRHRGYHTVLVTGSPFLARGFGLDSGFRERVVRVEPEAPAGYARLLRALGLRTPEPRVLVPADTLVAEALAALEGKGDRVFLYLHLMDPHPPFQPPARLVAPTGGDPVERLYDAEVRFADEALGTLFAALPPTALVVVASDHGLSFQREDGLPPRPRHGHHLRQDLVHVPLLVAGPGVPRGEHEAPVSLSEVGPAILSWAAGGDFAPPGGWGRGLPVSEAVLGASSRALRRGAWKLIAGEGGEEEDVALYHLGRDPAETRDRCPDEPERCAEMIRILRSAGGDGARAEAVPYVDPGPAVDVGVPAPPAGAERAGAVDEPSVPREEPP